MNSGHSSEPMEATATHYNSQPKCHSFSPNRQTTLSSLRNTEESWLDPTQGGIPLAATAPDHCNAASADAKPAIRQHMLKDCLNGARLNYTLFSIDISSKQHVPLL